MKGATLLAGLLAGAAFALSVLPPSPTGAAVAGTIESDAAAVVRVHEDCRRAERIASRLTRRRSVARVRRGVENALERLAEAQIALTSGSPADARRLLGVALRRAERTRRLAQKLRLRERGDGERWTVALDGLGGALLSVWTTSGPEPDVYAVGADDGNGPLFLRGSAEAFVRIPVAPQDDLWWVAGVPGDGPTPASVWACGDEGRVVVYDPATGAVSDRSTGANATLFGVWGSGPSDVWTVGGDLDGVGPRPAISRWDGATWTSAAVPPEAEGKLLYKVWGTAADDVWACGQNGLLLRFDGTAWTNVPSGTASTLLTVHGGVAVGGPGVAAVAVERNAAGTWLPASLPVGTESLNGAFVPAAGDAWAVGYFGEVLRREGGRWTAVSDVPVTRGRHHHAVHVDDAGGVWIAGGDLFTLREGSLVHFGEGDVPREVLRRATLRADVQPVIYASCAFTACHVRPFLSEELDLETPESTHAGLVGVPSRQSALLRVRPGSTPGSYLWHKLLGTQATVRGSGVRMPQGDAPLTAAETDLVRAWIVEGALND